MTAAVVIFIVGWLNPDMTVEGFGPAFCAAAAIAIGVVTWFINWLLGVLGLA